MTGITSESVASKVIELQESMNKISKKHTEAVANLQKELSNFERVVVSQLFYQKLLSGKWTMMMDSPFSICHPTNEKGTEFKITDSIWLVTAADNGHSELYEMIRPLCSLRNYITLVEGKEPENNIYIKLEGKSIIIAHEGLDLDVLMEFANDNYMQVSTGTLVELKSNLRKTIIAANRHINDISKYIQESNSKKPELQPLDTYPSSSELLDVLISRGVLTAKKTHYCEDCESEITDVGNHNADHTIRTDTVLVIDDPKIIKLAKSNGK